MWTNIDLMFYRWKTPMKPYLLMNDISVWMHKLICIVSNYGRVWHQWWHHTVIFVHCHLPWPIMLNFFRIVFGDSFRCPIFRWICLFSRLIGDVKLHRLANSAGKADDMIIEISTKSLIRGVKSTIEWDSKHFFFFILFLFCKLRNIAWKFSYSKTICAKKKNQINKDF